jgi:hypothetical protein
MGLAKQSQRYQRNRAIPHLHISARDFIVISLRDEHENPIGANNAVCHLDPYVPRQLLLVEPGSDPVQIQDLVDLADLSSSTTEGKINTSIHGISSIKEKTCQDFHKSSH